MSVADIQSYTEIIRNITLSLGAITTPIIAYIGLKTWRKEYLGKKKTDTGYEILRKAYQIESEFKIYRRFYIPQYHMAPMDLLKDELQFLETKKDYYLQTKDIFNAFYALELVVKIEFGDRAAGIFADLKSLESAYSISVDDLIKRRGRQISDPSYKLNHEDLSEVADDAALKVVNVSTLDDPFQKRIGEWISFVERTFGKAVE